MILENSYKYLLMDARVQKEAISLIKAGHEVTILLFDDDLATTKMNIQGFKINIVGRKHTPPKRKLSKKQKRIFNLIKSKTINQILKKPLKVMEFAGFRRLFDGFRYLKLALMIPADAYHAHDYATLWLAAFCSKFYNTPFVYDSHELWSDCWIRNYIHRRVIRCVEGMLLPRANSVITVNDSIANILANKYGIERPIVVSNFPPYQPLTANPILRNRLNLTVDRPVVIYAGGFKSDRGIHNIISAAKGLPDVEFVIMGYGDPGVDTSKIDNFHILEPVPQKEVVSWLSSATVGIHPMLNTEPNQYYSLGNKVGDYIMAGLPIAVSDFPEMREIALNDDLGVVFDPDDLDSILAALKNLLQPENHARMKKNILASRNKYTWENEEPKLLNAYKRLEVA
jgi:glycosyltransferase involved in cell wall biosynthesis